MRTEIERGEEPTAKANQVDYLCSLFTRSIHIQFKSNEFHFFNFHRSDPVNKVAIFKLNRSYNNVLFN